ncbi:MAG: patatin-like phospholipase family protein [Leptospiraceae bacterium]|nr:patatin-like phospholipase family protein [Leptospiraceae bacterium]
MLQLPNFEPSRKKQKGKALLIEGGGMKGAFAGGVLTAMYSEYPAANFDVILAVSAGACSAAYYVTEPSAEYLPIYRLTHIWRVELAGKRLINPWKILTGGKVLNQTFLIDYLFKKKYPIKKERFNMPGTPAFFITVSNLTTGEPEYIKATQDNIFELLKAATSLPIVTKGRQKLDFQKYGDGAILDPLPIEELLRAGYTDITVVLNNPLQYYYAPYGKLVSFLSYPTRPLLARKMYFDCHRRYNKSKDILLHPEKGQNFRIIAPLSSEMSLLESNTDKLNKTINEGIATGTEIFRKIK